MAKTDLPGVMPDGGHMLLDPLPHAKALGMKMDGFAKGKATVRISYRDDLVGDPETGVIHGGVVTTLLDNTSGVAAFLAFTNPMPIATLDLRIDYNRAAKPGCDIIAQAECYKLTRSVAFVRATAFDEDVNDPVATSVGAFMIGANKKAGENK